MAAESESRNIKKYFRDFGRCLRIKATAWAIMRESSAIPKGGNKMMKRIKQVLSLLLMLCLVLTCLPAAAAAAEEGASCKAGEAVFTLRADSCLCGDDHTGEIGTLKLQSVDISRWKEQKLTIGYVVEYRCSDPSCQLYSDQDFTYFTYSGEHTFTNVDAGICHKGISESFTEKIQTSLLSGDVRTVSVSFTLTSDKGISGSVFHESVLTGVCTESYYIQNCWECTGCGYYFLNSDMSGSKYPVSEVLHSPVGHYLVHAEAKEPTCVSKGTAEYWECTRCGLKFSDSEGKNELTSIETAEPLAPHTYNADGSCALCGVKAAAGIRTGNGDTVW